MLQMVKMRSLFFLYKAAIYQHNPQRTCCGNADSAVIARQIDIAIPFFANTLSDWHFYTIETHGCAKQRSVAGWA
jgi:hypothetical protein